MKELKELIMDARISTHTRLTKAINMVSEDILTRFSQSKEGDPVKGALELIELYQTMKEKDYKKWLSYKHNANTSEENIIMYKTLWEEDLYLKLLFRLVRCIIACEQKDDKIEKKF